MDGRKFEKGKKKEEQSKESCKVIIFDVENGHERFWNKAKEFVYLPVLEKDDDVRAGRDGKRSSVRLRSVKTQTESSRGRRKEIRVVIVNLRRFVPRFVCMSVLASVCVCASSECRSSQSISINQNTFVGAHEEVAENRRQKETSCVCQCKVKKKNKKRVNRNYRK